MNIEADDMPDQQIYDGTTRRLHWATALLVGVVWVIGQTADWIPDGPLNTNIWSMHLLLGSTLAAVLVWRVSWRLTGGRRLPPVGAGILRRIAEIVHAAMYTLLFAVIALGIVNAFVRGYDMFDVFSLPQIGDKDLRKPVTAWHGFIADLMMGLAGLHATAALVHHYVWRDGLMRRMLPRLR